MATTASSPKMSPKDVKNLYRDFFRLYRKWPPELQRSKRFREHFINKVRTQFHENAVVTSQDARFGGNAAAYDEWRAGLMKQGRDDLDALKALLNNVLEKEMKLSSDGPIMTHLPPEERFMLLDVDVQPELEKTDQWGYLYADFKKNWFGQK